MRRRASSPPAPCLRDSVLRYFEIGVYRSAFPRPRHRLVYPRHPRNPWFKFAAFEKTFLLRPAFGGQVSRHGFYIVRGARPRPHGTSFVRKTGPKFVMKRVRCSRGRLPRIVGKSSCLHKAFLIRRAKGGQVGGRDGRTFAGIVRGRLTPATNEPHLSVSIRVHPWLPLRGATPEHITNPIA
jgi:hypothetical protein